MASKNGVKEMRLCNRSAEWLIKHAGSDEIAASIVSCCGVDVDIVDSGVSIPLLQEKIRKEQVLCGWLFLNVRACSWVCEVAGTPIRNSQPQRKNPVGGLGCTVSRGGGGRGIFKYFGCGGEIFNNFRLWI